MPWSENCVPGYGGRQQKTSSAVLIKETKLGKGKGGARFWAQKYRQGSGTL